MLWADEDSVRLLISIGGVESFVDDLSDGAGTATALRAAAKTTINIACGAACHSAHGGPHFVFAQDVAGTDNHYTGETSHDDDLFLHKCNITKMSLTLLRIVSISCFATMYSSPWPPRLQ